MSRSRQRLKRDTKRRGIGRRRRRRRHADDARSTTLRGTLILLLSSGSDVGTPGVVEARHASWQRSANLVSTALANLQKILSTSPPTFLFFFLPLAIQDCIFLFLFFLSFRSIRFEKIRNVLQTYDVGCTIVFFFCGIGKMMKLLGEIS